MVAFLTKMVHIMRGLDHHGQEAGVVHPKSFNIAEAKARLAELVQRAAGGEEIVIARNGRPQARLVALPQKPKRVPGLGAGQWGNLDDFDDPLPEDLLRLFEGQDEDDLEQEGEEEEV